MDEIAATIDDLLRGAISPLVTARRDAVQLLIFNRPALRNALSQEVRRLFAEETERAMKDDSVRAVIITGAGGNFSAGLDLKEASAAAVGTPMFRPHPGEAARALTKPVIAAVDGACVTGALEIALSCHFIIASERARFADTHAKVGLVPAWGMSVLLPEAVGIRRAHQMSMTGQFIDAETALSWGLVNEVVPVGHLIMRCLELANAICTNDSGAISSQLLLQQRWQQHGPAFDAEMTNFENWKSRKQSSR